TRLVHDVLDVDVRVRAAGGGRRAPCAGAQPRREPGRGRGRRRAGPDDRGRAVSVLKLTTYFGERDPAGDGFLADRLVAAYARHGVRISALFRGIEGFGLAHGLHSERLLTVAEDLPIVSVAVDEAERIRGLLPEVRELGVVTLEHARWGAD